MADTIEQKAMKIAMRYEKSRGKNPKDVSRTRCGYDIKSGNRCIEVKGKTSKKAGWFLIHNSIVRNLGKSLINYYIYVVYDLNNKPKLKVLDPDTVFKNLEISTAFLLRTSVVNKYGKDVKL